MRQEVKKPGDDLTHAFWVRDQVFTQEQKFSEDIEIDGMDKLAHHVIFWEGDTPFATARTFSKSLDTKDPADREVYIVGRVCILKDFRKNGIGLTLMKAIEDIALTQGAEAFELGAQCTAAGFYEKCGYEQTDHTYYEEYCKHVTMRKKSSDA